MVSLSWLFVLVFFVLSLSAAMVTIVVMWETRMRFPRLYLYCLLIVTVALLLFSYTSIFFIGRRVAPTPASQMQETDVADLVIRTSVFLPLVKDQSTPYQTLNLQQDALEKIGCSKIFTDTASGTSTERKGLEEALEFVREGDMLVVWRLDRLGRSLKHLIETITNLSARGIGFKSITENIDTTTSRGKLIFHIFGALVEFEREIIKRTYPGRASSRTSKRETRRTAKGS
jgi:hypothetical protein